MQKQLGGRTDTLKQALIDQKDNQLEQMKENLPDLTETDIRMIQQVQDIHLERLWSNFLATGNPSPQAPLADDPTLAGMLKQLGGDDDGEQQTKGDKEEMLAQFAQQLETERRKTLQMMESQAAQFEQEKMALRAREEQLRQELSKMQRTEEEIRTMPIPRPRDHSPGGENISGLAMSRARQNSVVMKMPQPIRASPTDRSLRNSGSTVPISPRARAQTGTLIVPRRPSNVDITKAPYQLMQGDQPSAAAQPARPGDSPKDPSTRSYESTESLLVDNPKEQRSCFASCIVM